MNMTQRLTLSIDKRVTHNPDTTTGRLSSCPTIMNEALAELTLRALSDWLYECHRLSLGLPDGPIFKSSPLIGTAVLREVVT